MDNPRNPQETWSGLTLTGKDRPFHTDASSGDHRDCAHPKGSLSTHEVDSRSALLPSNPFPKLWLVLLFPALFKKRDRVEPWARTIPVSYLESLKSRLVPALVHCSSFVGNRTNLQSILSPLEIMNVAQPGLQ